MATVPEAVSDMMVTVKSREIQRGLLAEMHNDVVAASRHFLAAAHMELVLASDYTGAGQEDLARRSRLSAASCLWRAGRIAQAQQEFEAVLREHPTQAVAIQRIIADLEKSHPLDRPALGAP